MHPYKRTIAALLVAGALVSQTPAIARADEGPTSSSPMACSMSRNINGQRWSSNDCNDMPKMHQDMETVNAMLARLFQSVPAENSGSQAQKQGQDQGQGQGQGQDASLNQGQSQDQGQGQDPSQGQTVDGSQPGSQNPSVAKAKPQLSAQTMDAIATLIRHLFDRLWFWS